MFRSWDSEIEDSSEAEEDDLQFGSLDERFPMSNRYRLISHRAGEIRSIFAF